MELGEHQRVLNNISTPMSRVSARAYCTVVVTIVACIFLSDDGMTAEDRSVDSLRDRVKVLAQARDKAAAELGLKEQQGIATSRDREHFITVAEFLEQQIADSCRQLVEKGGAAVSADLPCPSQATKGKPGSKIMIETVQLRKPVLTLQQTSSRKPGHGKRKRKIFQ